MRTAKCHECGMFCQPGEFHPLAACLMFMGCHDSDKVRANLAALSQPDEARDAARWRFVTSHAAEEQNEVAICGMGTFVGGGPQNGLRVWGASFGVDAEALVDAAMSEQSRKATPIKTHRGW